MEKRRRQAAVFLALGLALAAAAGTWRPTIYGNSEAEILRYIRQEAGERLGGWAELLTVADDGPNRAAVVRGERGKPDDVWVVWFSRDENGDYIGGRPERLLRYSGGVYSRVVTGPDRTSCFVVWNENPRLASMSFSFDQAPAAVMQHAEVPSLTVVACPEGWSRLEDHYYRADGSELL